MDVEVVAALIWDQDKFMIYQRPANKARGLHIPSGLEVEGGTDRVPGEQILRRIG